MFPIMVGLDDGPMLTPYLLILVTDALTRHVQDNVPRCMLLTLFYLMKVENGVSSKLKTLKEML